MAFIDVITVDRPRLVSAKKPSFWQRLAVWRTRRALGALDADALRDIGVSPAAAAREAQKGIWDVPATWKSH